MEVGLHRLVSHVVESLVPSRFRRLRREEKGTVIFISAAAMLVLCGVTGLGVDAGM
jgi:hypothetical protein